MYFWEEILERWLIYTQETMMPDSRSLFDTSEDARGKGSKYQLLFLAETWCLQQKYYIEGCTEGKRTGY